VNFTNDITSPPLEETIMIRNRVTLGDIPDMAVGAIAALPVDQLALLAEEARNAFDRSKRLKDWLDGAIELKYRDRAAAARAGEGKASGTVRFEDGDFVIVGDLPKKVRWDQPKLAEAVEIIRRDWNDDPSQYVRTEIRVSEAAYNAWPEAIRRLFELARTVETGKPSYRIEPVRAEVA
jgi:hypothetical protein